jgi:hypothetical protein
MPSSFLAKWQFDDPVLVDDIEPWPRATGSDDFLDLIPLMHKPGEPTPSGRVFLTTDAENSEPRGDQMLYLGRTSSNSLVAAYDDQVPRRDRLDPVGIQRSQGTLRYQRMAGVYDILSGSRECLS